MMGHLFRWDEITKLLRTVFESEGFAESARNKNGKPVQLQTLSDSEAGEDLAAATFSVSEEDQSIHAPTNASELESRKRGHSASSPAPSVSRDASCVSAFAFEPLERFLISFCRSTSKRIKKSVEQTTERGHPKSESAIDHLPVVHILDSTPEAYRAVLMWIYTSRVVFAPFDSTYDADVRDKSVSTGTTRALYIAERSW